VISGDDCHSVDYCTTCPQGVCTDCYPFLWFLDTDVFPPVCRYCSELPGCFACFSKKRCSICIEPAVDGPDLNNTIGTCSPCAENCRFCNASGSGKCDVCAIGYTLNSNQQCSECVTGMNCYECAAGYYKLPSGTCFPCLVQNCASCQSNGTCEACISGTLNSNGTACVALKLDQ